MSNKYPGVLKKQITPLGRDGHICQRVSRRLSVLCLSIPTAVMQSANLSHHFYYRNLHVEAFCFHSFPFIICVLIGIPNDHLNVSLRHQIILLKHHPWSTMALATEYKIHNMIYLAVQNSSPRLGTVAHACNSSTLGGQGGRIA